MYYYFSSKRLWSEPKPQYYHFSNSTYKDIQKSSFNPLLYLQFTANEIFIKSNNPRKESFPYSAVLKANVKFFFRSLGFKELKSKASGKKWWMSAQNAIPSHQDEEKFSIMTPWNVKWKNKDNEKCPNTPRDPPITKRNLASYLRVFLQHHWSIFCLIEAPVLPAVADFWSLKLRATGVLKISQLGLLFDPFLCSSFCFLYEQYYGTKWSHTLSNKEVFCFVVSKHSNVLRLWLDILFMCTWKPSLTLGHLVGTWRWCLFYWTLCWSGRRRVAGSEQ